ncbi:MAG TPA: AMP-binding protein, partial [Ilumatobacteraceae bacterium]|nr:AMP-binding protein [Ilumatobacteraceae bacterium]
HPRRPAIIVGDEALTHGEVERMSADVAAQLMATGLGSGDRVAVLSPNHLLVMVANLGILRSGATWIPLNPRDSVDTIGVLCRRFGVEALIHHADFADDIDDLRAAAPSLHRTIALEDLPRDGTGDHRQAFADPPAEALAAVFATGGTTGIPKGVCYSHRTLSAIIGNYVALLDHADPVFLAAGPLTHVSGRAALGVMAAAGTTVVLPRFDAGAALAAIERHRVTTMVLPVTMLTRLVAHPLAGSTDTSSLRRVSVGASPVPVDLIKKAIHVFGPVVAQNYGQTEAPMFISSMQPSDYFVDGRLVDDARLASCGRPTAFCELRVVDVDGADVAVGDVGEIVVRGNFVMEGYLDDDAATEAAQIDGWHRTGDLGTLDAEGYLTIAGRLKQMIITGGFNVFPAEVEGVLAERPEVYECAVIGLPDADWGERVVAVIELNEGADYDAADVQRFLRARLGGVKAPKELIVVDALPRNANGKILKNDLVERFSPPA